MPSLPSPSVSGGSTQTALPLPPLLLPPRQLKKVQISCKKWLVRFLLTYWSAARAAEVRALAPTTVACDAVCSACSGTDNEHKRARQSADLDADSDAGDDICCVARRVCVPYAEASGFIVLNGGILAGCTPYDLRATLLRCGLLQLPLLSTTQSVLSFSSTLPFVACAERLTLPPRATSSHLAEAGQAQDGAAAGNADLSVCVAKLSVSAHELRSYAATAQSAEREASSTDVSEVVAEMARHERVDGTAAGCGATPTTNFEVAVLQVPPSAQLWKGGSAASSAHRGSGFLFLVPCDAAVVRAALHHAFQKPVVGIESLLRPSALPALEDERARGVEAEGAAASSAQRICVSTAVRGIPGLYLVEDFLTAAEEAAIWQELHTGRQELRLEYLSRRRVAHFNRRFIYGVNQLTREGEDVNARPSFYNWMQARLQNDDPSHSVRISGDYPFQPGTYPCDQLTVNYYDYSEMGACGIATHVDAHSAFEDAILIVSLGSYTVMDFARWNAPAEVTAPIGVFLPRRSLAVMSGESRYGWTHCIAEKRTDTVSELLPTMTRGDRLSLTWRRGRAQPHRKADCFFPALCDGE